MMFLLSNRKVLFYLTFIITSMPDSLHKNEQIHTCSGDLTKIYINQNFMLELTDKV